MNFEGHSSFLLLFKVSGDRSSFAKPLFPSTSETIPGATRINLVTSGKLQDWALLPGLKGFFSICLNLNDYWR